MTLYSAEELHDILIAVKGLSNQDELFDIACNNPCWKVRDEAITNHNLNDEEYLFFIAEKEVDDFLVSHAFDKLKALYPKSRHLYTMDDIKKIKDENKLIDILKNSIYRRPEIAGGKDININKIYPYLICPDRRWVIRRQIAESHYLENEEVLKDIVLNDYHIKVRCAAVSNPNLYDQFLFRKLALYSHSYTLRAYSCNRINDNELLKRIIMDDKKGMVRSYALKNIDYIDDSLYEYLALNDSDYHIRKLAVLKISNDDVLQRVYEDDYHAEVKLSAISVMNDKKYLERILRYNSKLKYKEIARRRLDELLNM